MCFLNWLTIFMQAHSALPTENKIFVLPRHEAFAAEYLSKSFRIQNLLMVMKLINQFRKNIKLSKFGLWLRYFFCYGISLQKKSVYRNFHG